MQEYTGFCEPHGTFSTKQQKFLTEMKKKPFTFPLSHARFPFSFPFPCSTRIFVPIPAGFPFPRITDVERGGADFFANPSAADVVVAFVEPRRCV